METIRDPQHETMSRPELQRLQLARLRGVLRHVYESVPFYRQALRDGIHFDQYIGESQNTGAIRIIVVDENSGRLGSVTLPSGFATGKPDP